ncbi:MAG: hypothetical protein K8R54_09590 [Bacteroidales bacterium]|nr:hypothetical protein [Bacteroidales bacterium]
MKKYTFNNSSKLRILIILISLYSFNSIAQNDSALINKFIKKTDISAQWFLAHTYDITENSNQFSLKRGYFTIKTDLNPYISVRYTQDITLDKEGSDAGNVEIRMKYLYMKLKPFKTGFFKNTFAEFGLVHRPWLDFEQKIDDYRAQGKMFIEKSGIFNSADFGITIGGLLGGKLENNIQKKIGTHYPGKFGSYSLGIYNGAGYHDNEFNNNKTIEGRLTIRPVPDYIPGLQFSYSTAFGEANIEDQIADFNMHLFFLSFESAYHIFTAQYYSGIGDTYGRYYLDGNAYHNDGYSLFGEFKIPKTSFAVFSRYDNFTSQQTSVYEKTGYFAGLSYRFLKNKIIAYYGQDIIEGEKNEIFEIVLEVAF